MVRSFQKMTRRLSYMLCALALSQAAVAAPPSATLNARLLAAHNSARKAVDVAPLVWSDALASSAREWAVSLARTGRFEHAKQPSGKAAQGENLWMGTSAAYTPEDMVGSWTSEKKYYARGIFPKVSTTKSWADVGHYTQMIWHNTTAVGCALVAGDGDDYLVCRYSPAGNWIGQDPQGNRASEKQTIKKKAK